MRMTTTARLITIKKTTTFPSASKFENLSNNFTQLTCMSSKSGLDLWMNLWLDFASRGESSCIYQNKIQLVNSLDLFKTISHLFSVFPLATNLTIYFQRILNQPQNKNISSIHFYLAFQINWFYLLKSNWANSHFNKFPDFFVRAFKNVVDSWTFRISLPYMLWDDWSICMISASNEQLQQQLE